MAHVHAIIVLLLFSSSLMAENTPSASKKVTSISACTDVMNPSGGATNSFGILPRVYKHLGIPLDVYAVPVGVKSFIEEHPKHGKVTLRSAEFHTYEYEADPDYLGQDKIIFIVDVQAKRYRLLFNIAVLTSEAYDRWHAVGNNKACQSIK